LQGGSSGTYLIYSRSNNTVWSYYYDTSQGVKSTTQNLLAKTNTPPSTKPSYNGAYLAYGSSQTVYLYTNNVNKADWSKNFTSNIKQVELSNNIVVIRTDDLLDIYNLNDIKNGVTKSIYTSDVKPVGPFLIYNNYIYYEYQQSAAWNLRKIDFAGKVINELKAELSGAILDRGLVPYGTVIYVVTNGNSAHGIDANSLNKLWSISFPAEAQGPSTKTGIGVDGNGKVHVYVGSKSGGVYEITTEGAVSYKKIFSGDTAGSAVKDVEVINVSQGYVIFAIFGQGAIKARTSTGDEKSYKLDGEIVDFEQLNSNCYLATEQKLYAIPVTSNPLTSQTQIDLLATFGGGDVVVDGRGWLPYIIIGGILVVVAAGGIMFMRNRRKEGRDKEEEKLDDLFK
jgi:hypothetical protein